MRIMMELATPRLRLREWRESDKAPFFYILTPQYR